MSSASELLAKLRIVCWLIRDALAHRGPAAELAGPASAVNGTPCGAELVQEVANGLKSAVGLRESHCSYERQAPESQNAVGPEGSCEMPGSCG